MIDDMSSKTTCPQCSRKHQTIYVDGMCRRCVTNMISTHNWMKSFLRRRAAVRGWETRRKKSQKTVVDSVAKDANVSI